MFAVVMLDQSVIWIVVNKPLLQDTQPKYEKQAKGHSDSP